MGILIVAHPVSAYLPESEYLPETNKTLIVTKMLDYNL